MRIVDSLSANLGPIGRAALKALDRPETYPGLPPWEDVQTVLRLFRFEGLGDHAVWAVGQRQVGGFMVRRIVWNREPALNITGPALFASHAEVRADAVGPCLDALCALSVPPFRAPDTLGLDGTSYAVEHGSRSAGAALHWWEQGPVGWEPLVEWWHSSVRLLEGLLPSRSS